MLPVQASMEIQFTTRIFKEGRTFVAHALELDVSSCGGSKEKALKNLKEAVRLFLEEAEKMGTLDQILEEAGYSKRKQKIASPKFISVQRVTSPASADACQSVARFRTSSLSESSRADDFRCVRTEGDHLRFVAATLLIRNAVP
jgi:predicted RNase H-like HicB family nuclease